MSGSTSQSSTERERCEYPLAPRVHHSGATGKGLPSRWAVFLISCKRLLSPRDWQTITITQDIVFSNTATATLDKPTIAVDSVIWLGNDLGPLTLEADQRTVSVETAGVAICRVAYRALARSWGLSSQQSIAGFDAFPIEACFTGTTAEVLGAGEIFCQRGDGAFRGNDIADPLLSTD